MIFTETRLEGAYLIELEPIEDERGFFARTFCREEYEKHGLNPRHGAGPARRACCVS